MTRDEIIRMAREAGSIDSEDVIETVWTAFAAAEREACAKVCDEEATRCEAAVERAEQDEVSAIRSTAWKISVCAAAIRARGQK